MLNCPSRCVSVTLFGPRAFHAYLVIERIVRCVYAEAVGLQTK